MHSKEMAAAILAWLLMLGSSSAQFIIGPLGVDLGNLANDQTRERQIHVIPLSDTVSDPYWSFFSPFEDLSPSPIQSTILLTEADRLGVVIPHLQHFPTAGEISATHHVGDNYVSVDASLHTGPSITLALFGPHEYVLPIGNLAAGQYRLDFNLEQTTSISNDVRTASGFLDFEVSAVPEPHSIAGCMLAFLAMVATFRHRRNAR